MSKPDPFDDLKALREAGESVVEVPQAEAASGGFTTKAAQTRLYHSIGGLAGCNLSGSTADIGGNPAGCRPSH